MSSKKQHKKQYYSAKSINPLDQWNENVDPAVMSGQHWEREENSPTGRDVGWEREENQDLLQGFPPQGGRFMHPVHDVSYDDRTDKEIRDEC